MITIRKNLNLIPGVTVPEAVNVSQYDKASRTVEFTLYDGDELFTVPSGSVVTVQGTKKDKTGFQYPCTVSGSVVAFDIIDQMTVFAGPVTCELSIVQSGKVLGSANFILAVEPAALRDDTVISETDIPIIEEIIEMAPQIASLVEEAVEAASDAASSASDAADSASAASSSASAASGSASDAAGSASAASASATQAAGSVTDASASASAAATSASNAATSASQAATSASNAATSETNAATSATDAAASAAAAAQILTNADYINDQVTAGQKLEFGIDSQGKGLYRPVGAANWIPFLTGGHLTYKDTVTVTGSTSLSYTPDFTGKAHVIIYSYTWGANYNSSITSLSGLTDSTEYGGSITNQQGGSNAFKYYVGQVTQGTPVVVSFSSSNNSRHTASAMIFQETDI